MQYGQFMNEKLIVPVDQRQDTEDNHPRTANPAHPNNQKHATKPLSPTNFEGCVIITINLVSLIWGLTIYDFTSISYDRMTRMDILFLVSMSTVIMALLISIGITFGLYLIGFIIGNPFRNSVFGCCPVFLFLMFYVEYGIIIFQGFKILTKHKNLNAEIVSYIIFQLIVGMIFYSMACYRVFCDKRMISPHLMELEKETYEIRETEIQEIRREIQLAKEQKSASPKKTIKTEANLEIQQAI